MWFYEREQMPPPMSHSLFAFSPVPSFLFRPSLDLYSLRSNFPADSAHSNCVYEERCGC